MPKRKEQVQAIPTVQPPEAGLRIPEPTLPFTEQAATIPAIPGKGATPAMPPRAERPAMRPPTKGFDPTGAKKKRSSQHDSVITLTTPVTARTSVLGTNLLGECSMANGLGNQEPVKVHVGFSDDNTQVFLQPVGPLANLGVEVTYHQGSATIALWQAFQDEGMGGKVVEEGYREQYDLWRSDGPVTIHGTTGYAVWFSLEHRERERISSREGTSSDGAPKAKKATATKEKAKKAGASAEEDLDATAEADRAALSDIYDEIAAEREMEIEELKKKLKQYEEKYGKA